MFLPIFIAIILAALSECKVFMISGPGWRHEIKACGIDGERHHTYSFYLGKLSEYDVQFEEINSKTTAVLEGDLRLKTGKAGWMSKTELHLSQFSESSDYKQFRGKWNMESQRLWASQIVEMMFTLKVYDSGKIYMDSYISAGSWLSVSCAEVKAYAERAKIAVSDEDAYNNFNNLQVY